MISEGRSEEGVTAPHPIPAQQPSKSQAENVIRRSGQSEGRKEEGGEERTKRGSEKKKREKGERTEEKTGTRRAKDRYPGVKAIFKKWALPLPSQMASNTFLNPLSLSFPICKVGMMVLN